MEFMDYFNIGMGVVLIVMGWLCYRFPNIINPYGGLPPERKALVDIEGLKRATLIILAVTGILLIVTALLSIFKVIDEVTSAYAMTVIVLAMIVPVVIAMKKYNGFGRDRSDQASDSIKPFRFRLLNIPGVDTPSAKWTLVIIGLTVVFIVAILTFSNQSPKIEVGEETISISGMYGSEIPVSGIVSVELLEKMPPVKMRTNGSSTHKYNKGHFLLKSGENCMMFIHNEAPYIELRTTNNLYYFNGSTREETTELFEKVKELIP